jgi:hypothetical protein
LVAVEFLDWLELPGGLRWVNVGCATGALSEAILDRHNPTSISQPNRQQTRDRSPGLVEHHGGPGLAMSPHIVDDHAL